MGVKKKKPEEDPTKNTENVKTINFRLQEGTALQHKGAKKDADRLAVWVSKGALAYEMELKKLQTELMKLQQDMKKNGTRVLAIFEGRDAAGKGGTIKRFSAFLNPRNTRIVALTAPNDREFTQWYFQRYVPHLPSAGELVIFGPLLVQPGHGRTGHGILHR